MPDNLTDLIEELCARQPHPVARRRARCLRPCQRAPSDRSEPLSAVALAFAAFGRARRYPRIQAQFRAGEAHQRAALFRAGHSRLHLSGAQRRHGGVPSSRTGGDAVLRLRQADRAGVPCRRDDRRADAVLGPARRVRRHQSAGGRSRRKANRWRARSAAIRWC